MSELKKKLLTWQNGDSLTKYWGFIFIHSIYKRPIAGFFVFIFSFIYSYYISSRLIGLSILPRVCFSNGIFGINLNIHRTAKIVANSGLAIVFEKWNAGTATTFDLAKNSSLVLSNTLHLGEGCKIKLDENASLSFSGKSTTQSSGITSDSTILCSKSISFGAGTIISWGCYFSDSSQHQINGTVKIGPLIIGEHVWVSEGVSCGPGCIIGNGSIIGCKSYVNSEFPPAVLLGGVPAKIIKENVTWQR